MESSLALSVATQKNVVDWDADVMREIPNIGMMSARVGEEVFRPTYAKDAHEILTVCSR